MTKNGASLGPPIIHILGRASSRAGGSLIGMDCRIVIAVTTSSFSATIVGVCELSMMSGSLLPLFNSRTAATRSEEHTSELQSLRHLVCRLLLEKKKNINHLF